MATEKKTVHDFEFVGRLINIMKILQEETDEFNTSQRFWSCLETETAHAQNVH